MIEMPAWVTAAMIAIVLWEFVMIVKLVQRVKRLRKIIRKLEYPGFEDEEESRVSKTGGAE